MTTETPQGCWYAELIEHGLSELIQYDEIPAGMLPEGIEQVRTFDQAGLLTGNPGLVLTMDDGTEFQVSIVQSK
jgi:hypothetical protein